jgi:AraC-like DNA-binding protein
MSAALHSLIEVRLHWAERHIWQAGQILTQEFLPAHTLWIGQGGGVLARSGNREWKISEGDALLFPSSASRIIESPQGAEWISVGLSAASPGQNDLLQLLPTPHAWQIETSEVVSQLVLQLAATTSADGASTLIRESLARALFGVLWQQFGAGDLNEVAGANFPDWLGAALQRMRESPETSIGVLAREVGISSSQLRRGFHEFLGTSPQEYSRHRRLEAARRAVENSDAPLHLIATAHGFSSAALFSRAMKKAFGLAPLELRRAAQQPPV